MHSGQCHDRPYSHERRETCARSGTRSFISREKKHETVCNIVGAIALLTFVGGPLSAQEKIKEGAEKTKHAVVKGAKATTEATKVNRLTVGSKRKD